MILAACFWTLESWTQGQKKGPGPLCLGFKPIKVGVCGGYYHRLMTVSVSQTDINCQWESMGNRSERGGSVGRHMPKIFINRLKPGYTISKRRGVRNTNRLMTVISQSSTVIGL